MSSEMRELIACADEMGNTFTKNVTPVQMIRWHDAMRAAIALLARTEAGADGVSIWRYRFRNSETGGWHEWRYSEQEPVLNSFVADKTEIQGPFTHPQDASGDAEALQDLMTTVRAVAFSGDYGISDEAIAALSDALDDAMQAKEAK